MGMAPEMKVYLCAQVRKSIVQKFTQQIHCTNKTEVEKDQQKSTTARAQKEIEKERDRGVNYY